ncbi:MAG: class I SAM-dependent methyltransferase [Bauldia sp.]
MVNIHIHQFQPAAATVDAGALEQFQKQWSTYQKLVDFDVLSHRAVGDRLGLALADESPFGFLDIACGDASLPRRILPSTAALHYHGIDLSEPAIELAAANLRDLPFRVDLDHRDFVEAMSLRPQPADVGWCSLSIHHLDTANKRQLLSAIREATQRFLMIYEPARSEDEDREGYLDRFTATNKPAWTMLTPDEWAQIEHHVRTSDLPETASVWLDLGREAGFARATEVFVDPTNLYRLFRYDIA